MEQMSSVNFREFAQLFVHIGCWCISWRKCWVSLGELYVLWGNCFEEKQHLLRRTWTEVHLHDSGSFQAALRLYLKERQRVFAGKTNKQLQTHKYRSRRDLQCVKTNLSRTIPFYILLLTRIRHSLHWRFVFFFGNPWLEGTVKTGRPRPL